MTRTLGLVCCVSLLVFQPMFVRAGQAAAQDSPTVTVTATIEAIDKANRTLTLKAPKGHSVQVAVPEQMQGFNSLKVGDQVTATYYDAIAINLRKPGAPAASGEPMTTTQRKDRTPGSETRSQRTFTVTVAAVDPKTPSITVKGPEGRVVALALKDPAQLKGVKVGDTVDVTYYESLLIKVDRPKK